MSTPTPLTSHELEARGMFYRALAELQSQLTARSTLADALQLMPKHGLAWYYAQKATVLGHAHGHEVRIENSVPAADLEFLLGMPWLVVGSPEDKPEAAATTPTPAPAPEPDPDPDPAAVAPKPPDSGIAPQPQSASLTPDQLDDLREALVDDPSLSTRPLSPEDANTARSMVAELSTAQKTTFKKAFCETFAISPAPLRIAGLITEERHAEFVRRFVDEAEGVARP